MAGLPKHLTICFCPKSLLPIKYYCPMSLLSKATLFIISITKKILIIMAIVQIAQHTIYFVVSVINEVFKHWNRPHFGRDLDRFFTTLKQD